MIVQKVEYGQQSESIGFESNNGPTGTFFQYVPQLFGKGSPLIMHYDGYNEETVSSYGELIYTTVKNPKILN